MRVLRESEDGKGLLAEPERWLPDKLAEVRIALTAISGDVVDSVNFYVQGRETEDASFDPKVVLKSMAGVRALERDVLSYARQALRDAALLFDLPAARAADRIRRRPAHLSLGHPAKVSSGKDSNSCEESWRRG